MEPYEKQLEIDFSLLEENLRDHSINYAKCGEHYADLKTEAENIKLLLEEIKNKLNMERSTIDLEIRNDWSIAFAAKPTENGIKAYIETHAQMVDINVRYFDTRKNLIEKQDEVDKVSTSLKAFEHRRSNLEDLVKLYINNYWSKPKVKQEAVDKLGAEERRAAHNEKIKKTMLRRKNKNV